MVALGELVRGWYVGINWWQTTTFDGWLFDNVGVSTTFGGCLPLGVEFAYALSGFFLCWPCVCPLTVWSNIRSLVVMHAKEVYLGPCWCCCLVMTCWIWWMVDIRSWKLVRCWYVGIT